MCVCVCVNVSTNTDTWEVENVPSKHKTLRTGLLSTHCNLTVPRQTAALTYVPAGQLLPCDELRPLTNTPTESLDWY